MKVGVVVCAVLTTGTAMQSAMISPAAMITVVVEVSNYRYCMTYELTIAALRWLLWHHCQLV